MHIRIFCCNFAAANKKETMKKIFFWISVLLFITPSSIYAENIGVPAECEDVMLQAFYWNSYTLTKYGRTKWNDLLRDTAAINANFDLVWFPPSASSSGGVGYYHAQLSNQDSDWGPKMQLQNLIAGLHKGGTKCIADIVINHRGNKSSWTDFYMDNFGSYGSFQLTQEHICAGDEAFTTSTSTAYQSSTHGAADTGTNDGGCRDLDHTSDYVQTWAKAYVQWMINVMLYDGFRYDMTLGYHGRYLSMYNEAANPYLSVSELWSDINTQLNHLKAADYNTMIFDFPLKYVLNSAIGGSAGGYGGLRNPSNSLRGKGYSGYAVTFLDNHDTFERSDNQSGEFIGYNVDLSNENNKNKILQAYAYLLTMPGIPCVFWPHWKSYETEINELIAVRKLVGIHSESAVSNETGGQFKYEATVQGHRGKAILRLGKNRATAVPDGYHPVVEYANYAVYVENGTAVEEVNGNQTNPKSEKFVESGRMYIRHGDKVYDMIGRRIK